jgi:5,10-methylenetetrahydrofolate reductase
VNTFRWALEAGRFVVTGEVGPPKGTDVRQMQDTLDLLIPAVDALNVTENQSAVMRMGSLAVSHEVVLRGGEPICQVAGRDRNRLALQNDLLSAHFLGIRNVLCLTGDHPLLGDHKAAKPVYDFDSVNLVQCVKNLNAGRDWAGNELQGATDFFVGAVVAPDADPLEPQFMKFQKKVEVGADFFQTQAVYDMEAFARFMERVRSLVDGGRVKVLAGLVVLGSVGMARYMNDRVSGIRVPPAVLSEMEDAGKEGARAKGMDICARQIRFCLDNRVCDGVHIMAPGRESLIPDILALAGIGGPSLALGAEAPDDCERRDAAKGSR